MANKNPIRFSMALPEDVNLDDVDWFPDEEPLTPQQKEKAERAWDNQRFVGLTVKEARYMLQRHGVAGRQ
jgi:hypothetical protein